ncbi:MAG: hypothetical protein Q9166_007991 [cf. Caloplaca sp. 2 TL-2023]
MLFLRPYLFLLSSILVLAHPLLPTPISDNSLALAPPSRPSLSDTWPDVPGRPFSLTTLPLPHPARPLSRTKIIALIHIVFSAVEAYIRTHGNDPIPHSPPLDYMSEGIKFSISGSTGSVPPPHVLRYGDMIPILAVFRVKMSQEGEWRELSARIQMGDGLEIGRAKMVMVGMRALTGS